MLFLRHMKLYSEAAALVNITVTNHEVTYDPDASWLKFHLGINRYALYSRDDPATLQLIQDMQSMTVVSAGEGQMQCGGVFCCTVILLTGSNIVN